MQVMIYDLNDRTRGWLSALSFQNVCRDVYFQSISHLIKISDKDEYRLPEETLPSISICTDEAEWNKYARECKCSIPADISLLVLHHSNEAEWKDYAREHGCEEKLVIQYSGGKQKKPPGWIPRAVKADKPVTVNEAQCITEWAKEAIQYPNVPLPECLGGSKEEPALRLLSALLPIGMFWEAGAKDMQDAIRKIAPLEAGSFESALIARLQERAWPEQHIRRVDEINQVLETSPQSPERKDLNSVLKSLSLSVHFDDWNQRLTELRDALLP